MRLIDYCVWRFKVAAHDSAVQTGAHMSTHEHTFTRTKFGIIGFVCCFFFSFSLLLDHYKQQPCYRYIRKGSLCVYIIWYDDMEKEEAESWWPKRNQRDSFIVVVLYNFAIDVVSIVSFSLLTVAQQHQITLNWTRKLFIKHHLRLT